MGSQAFIAKTISSQKYQVYLTDGTVAGTTALSGASFTGPVYPITAGGQLYFYAVDGSSNLELWSANATGVTRLDPNPNVDTYSAPYGYAAAFTTPAGATNVAFFAKTLPVNGTAMYQLYVTDGSAANTKAVPGATFTAPQVFLSFLTPSGTSIYFAAVDGSGNNQIWTSNGSTVTRLDPNPNQDSYNSSSIFPTPFISGGKPLVAFFANNLTVGGGQSYQLYVSDGTSAGTTAVAGATFTNSPFFDTVSGGSVYFSAAHGSDNQVYASNGTTLTRLDPNANQDSYTLDSSFAPLTPFVTAAGKNDIAFFAKNLTAGGAAQPYQLYASDGTAAGTAAISGATFQTNPYSLRAIGTNLYFTSKDGSGNYQVFDSNGSNLVRLDPNANMDSYALNGAFATLTPFTTAAGTSVAFFASNPAPNSKYQLYVTDGTTGGTHAVAGGPTFTTDPETSLGQAGSLVYFTANDGQQSEVFVSDGQTVRKLDPNANQDSLGAASGVTAFTGSDGKQYFAFFANNLAAGGNAMTPKYEMVVSDGTVAGTKAFTNASFATVPFGLAVNGTSIYFTAADGGGNQQVWTASQSGLSRLDPNANQDTYTSAQISNSTAYSIAAADANKASGTSGTTPYTFTVTRAGDDTYSVTLAYKVTGSGTSPAASSAIANPTGTVTFAPGVSATTLTVNVNGAPLTAAAGFTVTLAGSTDPTGNQSTSTSQISTATAAGTIGANVAPPAYSIAATNANQPDGTTGTTPYTFTITRTGDTSQATTLAYAVAGSGANPAPASLFQNPTGTVSLAAGVASAVLTVNAVGAPITAAEGFGVTISGGNGSIATATAAGTIGANVAPPAYSIAATDANKPDGTTGTTPYTFTVSRTGDTSQAATLTYTVAGSGTNPAPASLFQNPTGTVSLAAGASSAVVTVNAAGASITAAEGFGVTISGGNGSIATATASGTIGSNLINPITVGNPVFRLYNSANEGHFFTSSVQEILQIQATNKLFSLEGPAFTSVDPASNPNSALVYRFYEPGNDSHFYTDSVAEVAQVQATRPDMILEGPAFSVDPTMQAGDITVYRLFETLSDTHLYTQSVSELASIQATRPDIHLEGPAFYVKA